MSRDATALLDVYTALCVGGDGRGLSDFLPPGRTIYYGYGRQALADALRRGGVGAGDTVLLPGFICREVLASLAAVGAQPRFYDVDEALTIDEGALDRAAAGRARAVIAVNYFGFPQPLAAIRRWGDAHGAMLIEDNAHGFLSADGATSLGHRGDVGVFSFRKTLALPNGAALVDNRAGTPPAAPAALAGSSPAAAELRYRLKASMKRLIRMTGVSGARATVAAVRLVRRALTGAAVPRSRSDIETCLPTETYAALSARLLARVDVAAEQRRRRELFAWCRERLDGIPGVRPLADELGPGVVPQGFPFRYTGDDAESFIRSWGRRGVPMIHWPELPTAIAATAPVHYRRVLLIPFLW